MGGGASKQNKKSTCVRGRWLSTRPACNIKPGGSGREGVHGGNCCSKRRPRSRPSGAKFFPSTVKIDAGSDETRAATQETFVACYLSVGSSCGTWLFFFVLPRVSFLLSWPELSAGKVSRPSGRHGTHTANCVRKKSGSPGCGIPKMTWNRRRSPRPCVVTSPL